jgi:cyclopropane-fatty-acyl-phospholipid synthase
VTQAGEAAYRVWRLYMAASAVSFDNASIGIYQSLLARPDASGGVSIPLTRRDLYADTSSRPAETGDRLLSTREVS